MMVWRESLEMEAETESSSGTAPSVRTSASGRSHAAKEFAAPIPTTNLANKERHLQACRDALDDLRRAREEIDRFADDPRAITPGIILDKASCDKAIRAAKEKFDWHLNDVFRIHHYELQLALWETTRVCLRCGTGYMTEGERAAVRATFEMPVFQVPNEHEHCPRCETYQWKTPAAYFAVRERRAQMDLDTAVKRLGWAEEDAKVPNPGLFKRMIRKISDVPTLEDGMKDVDQARIKLDETKAERVRMEAVDAYSSLRVCAKCESPYVIRDGKPEGYGANGAAAPEECES